MNKFWKIIIALIFILLLWFCFEMMSLQKQQNRIDDLKQQMEENDKEYKRIMNEVNEVLEDGDILQ